MNSLNGPILALTSLWFQAYNRKISIFKQQGTNLKVGLRLEWEIVHMVYSMKFTKKIFIKIPVPLPVNTHKKLGDFRTL